MRSSRKSPEGAPAVLGSSRESGQVLISLLLMVSLIVLAMVGFAVDLTNLWFHRQAAQSAADSACQAGAMDLSAVVAGLTLPKAGFTPGVAGDCGTSSGVGTICFYAKANGFSGAGLSPNAASNSVAWSFPASVPGTTAPPASITAYPFLKVTVAENVKTHFLYTLQGTSYQKVAASCTCGLVQEKEAAPVIVLHPTANGAFTYSGGAHLTIVGGPQRSLQVNSTSATAINCSGSGLIDTSLGGPQGTGSDVAAVGGPAAAPYCPGGGFQGGTTGRWHGSALPVADPYASVAAPTQPALATTASTPHVVAYGKDGCPDHHPGNYYASQNPHSGCIEFEPGYYPSGINGSGGQLLILKPGLYYMGNSLNISGGAEVRMATPCLPQCSPYSSVAALQTDGIMFYFTRGSLNLSGGSGNMSSSRIDPVPATALTCDGSQPSTALGIPPTGLNGNVLFAQCTSDGTYWDSYGDTPDSRGSPGTRGMFIFQAHSNTSQPQMSGGSSISFSGTLYFHSSSYGDVLNLSGAASGGTFIIGNIVADKINISGSGAINLALNPMPSTYMLKVGMFQ